MFSGVDPLTYSLPVCLGERRHGCHRLMALPTLRAFWVRRRIHGVPAVRGMRPDIPTACAGSTATLLRLSRDSQLGQRNDRTLAVQIFDCLVNGTIEFGDASECLMSQVVCLQVVPDDLDVV